MTLSHIFLVALLVLFVAAVGGWLDEAGAAGPQSCIPGTWGAGPDSHLAECNEDGQWVPLGAIGAGAFNLHGNGPVTTVNLDAIGPLAVVHGGRTTVITPELLDKLESLK